MHGFKVIAKNGYFFYRGADKSLARPWKETSYSDQDLQHYTKTYGVQKQQYIPAVHTPQVLV